MDDLDRLFQHLVKVLSAEDPNRLSSPIQISELYQSIIPYRTHKKELEFDTNQDYEMALLRLLAGENEYATVEPTEVQEQLRLEVEAIDPNPSAFHEFAAARVTINGAAARSIENSREMFAPPTEDTTEAVEPDTPEWSKYAPPEDESQTQDEDPEIPDDQEEPVVIQDQEEPEAIENESDLSADGEEEELVAQEGQPRAPVFEAVDTAPQEPEPVPLQLYQSAPSDELQTLNESQCRHCAETLPTDRKVRFCPFCGEPNGPSVCDECGGKMEDIWRFCPDCGASSAGV